MESTTGESMINNIFLYVIGPVVAILAPAVVGYVKYKLNQKEKERTAEIAERDKRRGKIEADIEELKEEVAKLASLILGCKHPDCPTRDLLAEHFKNKYTKK